MVSKPNRIANFPLQSLYKNFECNQSKQTFFCFQILLQLCPYVGTFLLRSSSDIEKAIPDVVILEEDSENDDLIEIE